MTSPKKSPMKPEQLKAFRRIGHQLKPIVQIAGEGLSEPVMKEVERALLDHELIKVQVLASDRTEKHTLIEQLCETTGAELVQQIGHVALLYRRNPQAKDKLSNIRRFSDS